jgi:hypothetical protein
LTLIPPATPVAFSGRSPAWASSLAGDDADFHSGRSAARRGVRYPADPPTGAQIVAVLLGRGPHGLAMRGSIVVLS